MPHLPAHAPTVPPQVRNSALKALASFLSALETAKDRQPFTELVPYMLQTIVDALRENAEDECRDALEVLAPDPPLLSPLSLLALAPQLSA